MSLEAYQHVLCRMVASAGYRGAVLSDPNPCFGDLELTPRERRRLLAVAAQPGMRVNTAIHRANRLATIAQTMPFTCFLLSTRMQDVFDRFWTANPTESLQIPVECERFAEFLETEIEAGRVDDPYVAEIVEFEKACTRLRFYTGDEIRLRGWSRDDLPPLVMVVRFRHDPVPLLEALSELKIPSDLPGGEYWIAIDFRSGEADFRVLDSAIAEALNNGGFL